MRKDEELESDPARFEDDSARVYLSEGQTRSVERQMRCHHESDVYPQDPEICGEMNSKRDIICFHASAASFYVVS